MRYSCYLFSLVLLVSTVACRGGTQTAGRNKDTPNVDAEIAKIKEQLKAAPNSSDLHSQLSALAAIKGDWDTFEREIAIAIRLDPNRATNYFGAAEVYRQRGLTNKAFDMMKSAVAVDPQNPLSHFFLGLLYERQASSAEAKLEYQETKRLLDALRSPGRKSGNRIEGNIYYDRLGNTYVLIDNLDELLQKRLSHVDTAGP